MPGPPGPVGIGPVPPPPPVSPPPPPRSPSAFSPRPAAPCPPTGGPGGNPVGGGMNRGGPDLPTAPDVTPDPKVAISIKERRAVFVPVVMPLNIQRRQIRIAGVDANLARVRALHRDLGAALLSR